LLDFHISPKFRFSISVVVFFIKSQTYNICMAKTIGGWYVRPEDELQDFAAEVAQIVKQKLNGTYIDIEPEVVGGWSISPQQQMTMKAELIAEAVVAEIEEA
jgi:hypothetical protein